MTITMSVRRLALGALVAAALTPSAFHGSQALAFGKSKDVELERKWLGKTVHPKVNIHAEAKGGDYHFYSTNHIGLPVVIPVGADLVVVEVEASDITFRYSKENVALKLEYVEKHNRMPIGAWLDREFSMTPVALPSGLTDKERDAIKKGEAQVGMSREALFLAIGYPPASLTPSDKASHLIYEKKRFNKVEFIFDDKDHLLTIKN